MLDREICWQTFHSPNSAARAMLGASLAVRIHHPPISSLAQLVRSDNPILIMRDTSVYEYFRGADPDSDQGRLFAAKMEEGAASNAFDLREEKQGMELIANGEQFLMHHLFLPQSVSVLVI